MRLHGLTGRFCIAFRQRLHQGAVFGQRVFQPPLLEQRVVAVELHHLAQVLHDLHRPAVAGDVQQRHVELFVGGEEGVPVVHLRFQLGVQFLQSCPLRRIGLRRHLGRRIALQQRQQVVDLGHVVLRHLGDVGTAPHLHGHQAFHGQHLQRFAHGRAADAPLRTEFQLVDPAAGLQFARKDLLAQALGHLFVQGGGRQHPLATGDIGAGGDRGGGGKVDHEVLVETVRSELVLNL